MYDSTENTDVTDIKYWSSLNKINFNIHTLATIEKCRFVNLDQRQLQMDRSKKYDPATYYFDKAVKIRFRIQPNFFSKDKKSSRIALDTMEQTLEWVVKGGVKLMASLMQTQIPKSWTISLINSKRRILTCCQRLALMGTVESGESDELTGSIRKYRNNSRHTKLSTGAICAI